MKQLFLVSILACTTLLNAQTFGNMPFSTPQISNPAFIALNDLPKLNVYGKTGRRFNSSYVGYNRYAPKLNGTLGIYFNGFAAKDSGLNVFDKNNIGISYARLFHINEQWKYTLGTGVEISGSGSHINGETTLRLDLGVNFGGVLYTNKFFTALNFGSALDGRGQFAWRTGYEWQPFKNKDFSFTPIISINRLGGRTYLEGNVNLGYKELSLNLGYNYNGFNAGVGYDFKRFKLNYSLSNMFSIDSKQIYHEIGIQFKLSKDKQGGSGVQISNRLF